MRREQRRAAGQIDDQVATCRGAVTLDVELKSIPRRRPNRRVAVHIDLEIAQMPGRAGNPTRRDHQVHRAERQDVADIGQQQRDVQSVLEDRRRFQRRLSPAVNQTHAAGHHVERRYIRHSNTARLEEGQHLRRCRIPLLRPARLFTDVREGRLNVDIGFRQGFLEGLDFLRAGHRQAVGAARLVNEAAQFATAQLREPGFRAAFGETAFQRLAIQRHGAFAIADQYLFTPRRRAARIRHTRTRPINFVLSLLGSYPDVPFGRL